jgi:beta-glucosidase
MFLFLFSTVFCYFLPNQENYPFRNESLSTDERVNDLISRLSLAEKVSQMMDHADAIDHLGIPKYGWWSEALHGVARSGLFNIFI